MSLASVDVVAEEDSQECFWSQAHPAREASANAARQEKIKADGRMEVFVIFISMIIRLEPTSPMGCTPHDASVVSWCKPQTVKTDS